MFRITHIVFCFYQIYHWQNLSTFLVLYHDLFVQKWQCCCQQKHWYTLKSWLFYGIVIKRCSNVFTKTHFNSIQIFCQIKILKATLQKYFLQWLRNSLKIVSVEKADRWPLLLVADRKKLWKGVNSGVKVRDHHYLFYSNCHKIAPVLNNMSLGYKI